MIHGGKSVIDKGERFGVIHLVIGFFGDGKEKKENQRSVIAAIEGQLEATQRDPVAADFAQRTAAYAEAKIA